jgi:hypothetical protein
LFIPATIVDMVWGVRFLQDAHELDYSTATGVISFISFTFSSLLGPVFGWMLARVSGETSQMELGHYQVAFFSLLFGVFLAVLLTFILGES